jgi:filamentous hemagglutinin family protein
MNWIWDVGSWRTRLKWVTKTLRLLPLGIAFSSVPALAQIVPDNTLGTESSQVTPNINIRGLPGDRIDGGAVRGSNLFHSFSQFNVNNGQRVYFADPAGITNIFSRVTGLNVSNILGTLGVDGAANLFLLNPNGILFGPNALVDIQGSFVATTGDRFIFPNGAEFGASNPQAPPLLTMSVPVGVQYGVQPGTITNIGNLTVGQDLTLAGGNLDLQGQLRAGRDLTLQAQNTVRVRDSAINPFIASAGGKLVVQGNQAVDIVALSHPNSGLFSGEDMVLRSANTVGGDTRYWSGGNFRIETLDGNVGNLFSPADPVIRASGDVSFANYEGASLHIFAGGSVTIGDVTITGADTGADLSDSERTVTLSNGTPLNSDVDGNVLPIDLNQPILDIRAGTTAIGTPGITGDTTGFTSGVPGTDGIGTSADITIGTVDFRLPDGNLTPNGGAVFLTNQYSPNSLPAPNGITVGAIDTGGANAGGSVWIDGRTNITANSQIITSAFDSGTAGDINLLAGGDITINLGLNTSVGFTDGKSGNINLLADGDIAIDGYLNTSANSSPLITPTTADNLTADQLVGIAGNVTLKAGGNIRLNSNSGIFADGQLAGFVELESGADTFITDSFIFAPTATTSSSNSSGNSTITLPGEIKMTARSLSITGSLLSVEGLGEGNPGNINISATNNVSIRTSQIKSNSESINPEANFGTISIEATNGSVFLDESEVLAKSQGSAFAGDIFIDARDRIDITNSTISADGYYGRIFVGQSYAFPDSDSTLPQTPQTIVISDSKLTTTNSATIGVDANQEISSGDITIRAIDEISILNSNLEAQTTRRGNAGYISLTTGDGKSGRISLDNSNLSSKVEAGGIGNGGYVQINAGSLSLTNGAQLSTSSLGQGNAGDITINATRVTLNNQAKISAETAGGQGGNINITTTDLLLRNSSNISTSAGTQTTPGNGGGITINAEGGFVIAVPSENSNIVANAFGGQGGVITINANRVLGLKPETKVIDPTGLENIIKNPPSQISAGSDIGFAGTIEINTLAIDPSQGLGELPIEVVDPSGLIATGCGPTGGTTANRQSEFVVTGRGGLPPSPNDLQTPETPLAEWVTRDVGNVSRADIPDRPPTTDLTDTLVEAQGMVKTANGELLLTAEAPNGTPHQSGVSTQFCSPVRDRR